jgi:hypothetical protein
MCQAFVQPELGTTSRWVERDERAGGVWSRKMGTVVSASGAEVAFHPSCVEDLPTSRTPMGASL